MEPSDHILVSMVLNGNRTAFETIMQRHAPKLSSILCKRVPAERVAELLQETFIRAYKSLPGFSGKKPLENWLSVIGVRACMDFWRAEYRNKEVPVSRLGEDALYRLNNLSETKEEMGNKNQQAMELLDWAMQQLPIKERMVLSFTYLDGRTCEETAKLLGWSRSNVKVKSFRAKKKLRNLLKKLLDPV